MAQPQWVIWAQRGTRVATAEQDHLGALRLCAEMQPGGLATVTGHWLTQGAQHPSGVAGGPVRPQTRVIMGDISEHFHGGVSSLHQLFWRKLRRAHLASGSCSFGKYLPRCCLLPVNQCEKLLLLVLLEAANFPGDVSLHRSCSSTADSPRSLARLATLWMTPS